MALTKVSGNILDPGINVAGVVTATGFDGPFSGGTDGNFSGNVSIGGTLRVAGVSTFNSNIDFVSTDAGSAAGPELKLFRNSASPADADYLGQLKFAGESDTGVERNYAKITGKILDASNGTEDGILEFAHIKAGSQTITGRWRSDSLQLLNSTNLSVAGNADITGDVDIDNTTESTSKTTGALKVDGGVGIAKNLYVGGNLVVEGTRTEVKSASLEITDKTIGISSTASPSDTTADGAGIVVYGATDKTLTWQNSSDSWLSSEHIKVPDNKVLYAGTSDDLQIFHQSSTNNSQIVNTTGTLRIRGDSIKINNQAANKNAIVCESNIVTLYYDNAARLATNSTGISVTGEVAATQDYPNYRPTLDLNFAAVKKLDPRITYYRNGPASYIDEFGKVVLVGANTPRFDHDPTTRESKGLLVEESKTNLIPNSFDTGSAWNSGSGGTLTRNAGIAPDGTMTATKALSSSNDLDVNPSIGPASAGATTQIAISGSTTYTLSIWAKASTIAQVGNNFKVRWKRITGDGASSETTFTLTADWKRYSTTGTTAANNTTMACYVGGVSGSEALVWGAQLEVSSFPTSLIPTYGRSQTRGADNAFMDAIGDSFYNQNEGTSIMEYNYTEDTDGAHSLFSFAGTESDPDNSNPRQWLRINKTAGTPRTIRYSLTTDAGSSSDDTSSAVATPGQWDKFAFAYTSGDQDLYLNGSSVNDLSRTPPINCYRLSFGNVGWNLGLETIMLEGHIRRFMYYPKKLSNSQLGTLTS